MSEAQVRPRMFGARVKRLEDPRLLRGKGSYVADLKPHGMVSAHVVRSPHPHARIGSLDVEACRADPRTIDVITAADLPDWPPLPSHDAEQTTRLFTQHVLAREVVRYVGEPVAVVVAEDRYVAEDVAALIDVEYEPLDVVVDASGEDRPGVPILHEDTNVAEELKASEGDPGALAEAPFRLKETFRIGRYAGMPIETRGLIASWDPRDEELTVWISTQTPNALRGDLCRHLGIDSVRVIATDVGGAFGTKLQLYPEDVLVSHLAMRLARPVQWIEDRWEHFLGTTHGREQVHEVEVGYDERGVIHAIRDRVVTNTGAYLQNTSLVEALCAVVLLRGPYRVPSLDARSAVAMSNKVPMNPFRGVGHAQACFTMERSIDLIARQLGIDPVEVRLRNMLGPEDLPIHRGGQNAFTGHFIYDSGDYPAALRYALEIVGYDEFRRDQERLREEGRYLGIGISCFVEETGIGPYEFGAVRVEPSGRVTVLSGAGPSGQGIATALAQIAADELGVPLESVDVITGDTAQIPDGVGSYASRSAANGGAAVRQASAGVRARAVEVAASMLEASPADLELVDGRVQVAGSPGRAVSLADVAQAVAPGRKLPAGIEGYGLEQKAHFHPETNTFAYGTQIAVVEVDLETCMVQPTRFVVVGDCGRMVNPMIVDGQYHGGVSMGIGGALFEEMVYGEDGQPLNPNFMDYLLPTVDSMPEMVVEHLETPTHMNPDGVKGVGESGTIGAPAAIANAVEDALAPFGVRITETPITPAKLYAQLADSEEFRRALQGRPGAGTSA